MNNRADRLAALQVELAINLASSHGVAAGARALFEFGLPLELAHRVLLHPTQRRRNVVVSHEAKYSPS